MPYTLDMLDEALSVAKALGYRIRQEWLDGQGGGLCEFGGQKWFFLDLSLTGPEQLAGILEVLRDEPKLPTVPLSDALIRLLLGPVRRMAA